MPWFPISFSTSAAGRLRMAVRHAPWGVAKRPRQVPTSTEPTPLPPKRHPGPKPFEGSPPSRTATPVHPAVPLTPRHPQSRHPTRAHARAPSSGRHPPAIPARTRPVRIGVGSPGGISAPMAIPVAVPGAAAVCRLSRPLSRDPWHDLSWEARLCRAHRARPRVPGRGVGIRGTARVFEVDPNTVLQWLVEAAEQLRAFSRHVLHDVRVRQVHR